MSTLLLAWLLATAPASHEAVVTTLDGASIDGEIQSVADEQLTVIRNGQPVTVSLRDLSFVRVGDTQFMDPSQLAGATQVELVDQTKLVGQTVALDGTEFQLQGITGGQLVARRNVSTIRFPARADLSNLDSLWEAKLKEPLEGDAVILRKITADDDGKVSDVELVVYQGLIKAIDEDKITFEFNDSEVPVKRERVEGVRFYHPTGRQLPEPLCRLVLRDGSQLNCKSLSADESVLSLQTAAGVEWQVDWSDTQTLDFSLGRIVFLGDMQPTTSQWSPFFASPATGEQLERLNSYRVDRAFDGEPLTLYRRDGFDVATESGLSVIRPTTREFERGLALRSRTRLVFPLSGEQERFIAQAGVSPAVRPRGDMELIIRGDGEVLFETRITGRDIEPVAIDVEISGVRRLSIEVDFGEQLDIGDYLHLCNARVVK